MNTHDDRHSILRSHERERVELGPLAHARGYTRWMVALAASAGALFAATNRAPFLKPEEALKTFQLEPGLKIELVAAEPLVVDPVAMAFDDQGRLYVVENRGYPGSVKKNSNLPDPPAPLVGRIARLEDTDGDGRYDKRTEFATDLSYPNGITVWRGGVFVTCAPDILYLKDNDGDGVADERRIVLTGFETSRTEQLRVSSPTLGLDGKIYLASGLNGGKVTSPVHPEYEPIAFTPADGRFDPDTYFYERTGGRGQFGLSFDPFGHRFTVSNRHPVLQIVLEPWYLKRNPHLAFTDMSQEVSKVEAQARVFPISHVSVTADFMPSLMSKPHAGTFTSACGVLIFSGTALGADHTGNAFICEPAQNLVQRQVVRGEGASFRSDLPYEGREFLASTDVWFRPVFLSDGPDGALYVVDMNRREIDHPQYVPEEARGRFDFESGKATGRIYRVARADQPARRRPAMGKETVADLVRGLDSADGWWRVRAHRLLLERNDRAAVALLAKRVADSPRPEARAAALRVLQSLQAADQAILARALADSHPGVREQAVLLGGAALKASPGLVEPLLAKAADADAHVRFATALVLGSVEDRRAVPALAAIAVRDGADRWTRAAVLSGIGSRMSDFLTAVMAAPQPNPAAFAAVMEDLGRTFAAGAPLDACRAFLNEMLTGQGELTWRLSTVLGLADGLRGRSEFKSKSGGNPLVALAPGAALDGFIRESTRIAADERAPVHARISAIALLGYADFDRAGQVLGGLLEARHPPEIQMQAIRAFDRLGDPRGAELLVQEKNWGRYTASVREAVVASVTAKPKMIEVLFAAIRKGVVRPAEISSLRRTQLQKHSDPAIRKAAETLFADLESGDRMKVYRSLRDLLASPADAAKGVAVFARACAACHTFRGTGGKVGPDLSGVRHQPADALLLHIIVPNYEVVPAYQTITVTTTDGRSVSGWLASETETSLSLRTAAGTEENLLRKDVASLNASGLSLMPDGLEQTMTKDELVSLIAYLKSDPDAH